MGGNHQKLRENSGKMMLKILYEPCLNTVFPWQLYLVVSLEFDSL